MRLARVVTALIALLLFLMPLSTTAWGTDGYRMIANIATFVLRFAPRTWLQSSARRDSFGTRIRVADDNRTKPCSHLPTIVKLTSCPLQE